MTPAPTGTAAGISGWIRIYLHQARRGGLTIDQRARLDRLDACSSEAVAVGDDDPRVKTIGLSCPGPHWEPGREQRAIIDSAGYAPARGPYAAQHTSLSADKLNGNVLLNELAHAAVLDLKQTQDRALARLRKGAEIEPGHAVVLRVAEDRAALAERALREAQGTIEGLRDAHLREKARRRLAEAALGGDIPVIETNGSDAPAAEEKLPTGVRRRGGGYQAFWRVEGKQLSAAFDTVAEAAAHRKAQLEEAEVHRIAKATQGGGHDTFNPSPEDLAAMRDAA